MQPDSQDIERIIAASLAEDIGGGDVTSTLLIPSAVQATLAFVTRERIVSCGAQIAAQVFHAVDTGLHCSDMAQDGEIYPAGSALLTVRGNARAILTAERTALNLYQRMCSVATLAANYVNAVKNTGAVILDTRKTMPGLRALDKYAARAGGARNHRMGLYDGILIKDNHIAVCGGVAAAVRQAKSGSALPVEVECDTLLQLQEAMAAGAEFALLDNMAIATLKQAVALGKGRISLEASGGVTLETVRAIAETGVDFISVGRITHSAPCVDIGLDIVLQEP